MMQDVKGVAATITGVSGTVVSYLEVINTVVSIVAGILAAIASGYAIYYYIKKGKQ